MANWTTESQPFGANHAPLLVGLSSVDGVTPVPIAVDPSTGAIVNEALSSNSYVYTGSAWEQQRTPNTFKTITKISSGNTAIWTPTTGKKFRLMGYTVDAPDDVQVASAGDVDVTFNDSGSAIGVAFTFWAPDNTSTSNRHTDNSGVVQMGNGYLSTVANNVLNVNLSSAITLGKVRITVWGTEE